MLQIALGILQIAAIAWLVFFVRSALKPFVKSYSGEKGKRLATHEDFEQILVELKRTTIEVEGIKANLSNDVWHRQTVWNQKRDIYVRLLRTLGEKYSAITYADSSHKGFKLNGVNRALASQRELELIRAEVALFMPGNGVQDALDSLNLKDQLSSLQAAKATLMAIDEIAGIAQTDLKIRKEL